MITFIQGDRVIINSQKIKSKYQGKGIVMKWHVGNHYTVEHTATGQELVLLPDEMETVFDQDMRSVIWKRNGLMS